MKFLTAGLMHVTAGLETAKFARRLADAKGAEAVQQKAYAKLLTGLAASRYGTDLGIEQGLEYQDYRRHVPMATADSIQPYVDSALKGSPDELWPGRCRRFVHTNGAVTGNRRQLPVTDQGLDHFRTAAYHTALMHTANVGHAGVFHGKHLYLVSTTDDGAGATDLPAIVAGNLPRWTGRFLFEPGKQISSIPDWSERLEATVERAINQDITLIAGTPIELVHLIEAIIRQVSAEGRTIRNLSDIWPNLECVIHGGSPVAPYLDDLNEGLGRRVTLQEVFLTSEAAVAAHDGSPDGALRMLYDTGVFFEFLPLHAKSDDHKQALPLSGVKAGRDYELIVTTPSGLCRYRTDELVQFVSAAPPRLIYRGRRSLTLPAGDGFVADQDLANAMAKVCRRHHWTLEGLHVSPLDTEKFGRHEWWVELRPPCRETPISKTIEEELDEALRASCKAYLDRRVSGEQAPPVVRLITPGVFDICRKEIGRERGSHHYAICRPDRQVAEQLMQYAGVHGD